MLFFVTPAWGRPELSKIVLSQRRELCGALGARCVVVADDENLGIAKRNGFETVEQEPWPLGRKYNDGYQYAYEHGATHVCPLGSDSWALADYFLNPPNDTVVSGRWLGVVAESGDVLARLCADNDSHNPYGFGPFIIPRRLLDGCGGRPAFDGADAGIDRNCLENTRATVFYRETHQLQEVSFKNPISLDGFDSLSHMSIRTSKPWHDLAEVYPAHLVKRMRGYYERRDSNHPGGPKAVPKRDVADGDPVGS